MTPDVFAMRFQLPAAPLGELADFMVAECRIDGRDTTYVLVNADTTRFVDTVDTKEN